MKNRIIDSFLSEYYIFTRELLFDKDNVGHVIAMLLAIYNVIYNKQEAGDFITACCNKDWLKATKQADKVNRRYIGLYIIFVDYCNEQKWDAPVLPE